MIEKLPYYYRKSQVVKDIYAVIQKALDKMDAEIAAKDLQLFITTTDDFEPHEKDVGLEPIAADVETKRSRVIARLRGSGILTKAELENMVNAYEKSGCTITEDFSNCTVIITFPNRTGKPLNLEQMNAAIDEVKPAHLRFEYEILPNTWKSARSKLGMWREEMTWEQAQLYDQTYLYVDDNGDAYFCNDGANAYVVYIDNVPYARRME